MNEKRLAFIDWMKFLGILLIVYGHIDEGSIVQLFPPIFPKQLGVAFFIFVMGFSLVREKRPTIEVLFNRLFEMYLFGLFFAVTFSIAYSIGLQPRGIKISNYEPFLLGINVFVNDFPANQTTWFIGTYLHVLLFWAAAVRGRTVSIWVVVLSFIAEIPIRAALGATAGSFVAYQLISNWISVFLLGCLFGQQEDKPNDGRHWRYLLQLAALTFCWSMVMEKVPKGADPRLNLPNFPFMVLQIGDARESLLASSFCVSFLYMSVTWLSFEVLRRVNGSAVARFFAENTLVIFIAHMPIRSQVSALLPQGQLNHWQSVAVLMACCFLAPAVVSVILRKVFQVRRVREALAGKIRKNWA